MISISVTVDGIETLQRSFNRLDKIDDWRPIWPEVGKVFYEIEAEQFATEGAAGGEKWTPLSKVYEKFKAVAYPGQPILQADEDLRESLVSPFGVNAIYRATEKELDIGSKDPKVLVHHRGSPKKHIPKRKVINLSEIQKRRIQKAVQAGLVRFVREATS